MESKHVTGGVTAPVGFTASGVSCGIKKSGGKDLALIISDGKAYAAGMFTKNRACAAPVTVSREHLSRGKAKAIVINSGNANACNGTPGLKNAADMCRMTGKALGVSGNEVLVASTGVIGVPLPMEKISKGIGRAVKDAHEGGGTDASEAIMTTDTYAKEAAVEVEIKGKKVRVGGMAKGAGMINPDMATMIAVVTTDAEIQPPIMKNLLKEAVDGSFNCITVDGDMSTNDTVLMLANGVSGVPVGKTGTSRRLFAEALGHLLSDLAEELVKDGEGATKFIEIIVKGAKTEREARSVGLKVANSLLVKTAFFGEDANWGRIVAAIGASGQKVDTRKIKLYIGDEAVFKNGKGALFCYQTVDELIKGSEIRLVIDLGNGRSVARILTTDISYEYVKINAEYRT